MLKRTIVCLTFITILFAGQARARAQDGAPTILIQVRSLAAVMENVKLLVTLSGREAISKQVEELVKSKIGANGLEGIDPARPFGVYGTLKSINDGTVVLLVPIADENAFLKLLKNLNYEAKKNANTGIYTISGLPVEIYFRFSEKYAYVSTLNLDALGANNLLPPAKVFRADQKSAISFPRTSSSNSWPNWNRASRTPRTSRFPMKPRPKTRCGCRFPGRSSTSSRPCSTKENSSAWTLTSTRTPRRYR